MNLPPPPLVADSARPGDPLHGRVFADRDEAVAAWIEHAGPLQEVSVWVTPEQSFKVKLPMSRPPVFIPFKLVRVPDSNQFLARPMNWPWLVRLSQAKPFLGEAFSEKVIARLGEAGLVRVCKLTPNTRLVDLESLYQHLMATMGAEGSGFWTPHRRALYHEAAGIVR